MNEELTNDEVEIDLVDLGYALLDKWRYLLISLIAGAVLLGAYSFFFIAPTYESTAKLYVVSASDDSVVNLSDLNLGTSLTADYEQLMLSYPVLNRVIDCELPKINPLNAGFHPNNYAKFTCPACLQAYSVLFCSSSDVSPEVINARISS